MSEIADRIQQIRDRLAAHFDVSQGLCNSYYCDQDCSHMDETWDMIWDILNELAPET